MQELDVTNVRELEDFLINECMYAVGIHQTGFGIQPNYRLILRNSCNVRKRITLTVHVVSYVVVFLPSEKLSFSSCFLISQLFRGALVSLALHFFNVTFGGVLFWFLWHFEIDCFGISGTAYLVSQEMLF